MTNKFVLLPVLGALSLSLVAGPALATSSTSTEAQEKERNRTVVNLACMQTATDVRDTAILSAEDKLHTAWKSGLEKRKTALIAAWKIEDRKTRRETLKDAWKSFTKEHKTARDTFKNDRRAAWKKYFVDRKACGQSAAADDKTNESVDTTI